MSDYAPTKIGFRYEKRVRAGHEERIQFPLNGKAPRGYWNNKLEFGLEVVRLNPASAVKRTEAVDSVKAYAVAVRGPESMRRAFNLVQREVSPWPQIFLWGEDVAVSVLNGVPNSRIRFRHADCFTLCFVHRGKGRVLTDVGLLNFSEGDYIYLPRQTTYAFASDSQNPVMMIIYEFPRRLLRPFSFWVDGYPFSQAAPVPAEPIAIEDSPNREGEWDVYLRHHKLDQPSLRLVYPFSPFDAVAWEGEIYPFVLHLKDIRAISSPDMHIEPKVLTTFVTEDESALVQTFKPRWSHSLPYPHQNFVTEVLFNHRTYAARPKIPAGSVTLHPPGTFHGPDLRALKRDNETEVHPSQLPWREEVAVMLEVRSPLVVLPVAESVEIEGYEESWYRQWQELQEQNGGKDG